MELKLRMAIAHQKVAARQYAQAMMFRAYAVDGVRTQYSDKMCKEYAEEAALTYSRVRHYMGLED